MTGSSVLAERQQRPPRTAVESLDACPLCQAPGPRPWCAGVDRSQDQRDTSFAYARCGSCGVFFESQRPPEAVIHKAYPEEYLPYQHGGSKRAPGRISTTLHRLAAAILGQKSFQKAIGAPLADLREGSHVLDFGCGAGKFLDRMRKRGCRTTGIDFSPQAVETVAKNGHSAHLAGDSDSWREQIADGSIDLVRMNHVVEHLYHPRAVLAQMGTALRPGGHIHIAVPNPAGMTASLFRSFWYGLECPRHIILYPPGQLAQLVREAGFTDVQIVHEPQAKDHVRSWGYLLHGAGLLRHDRVEGLIHSGFLQLLASMPCRLASLLRLADRFHIIARRPAVDPADATGPRSTNHLQPPEETRP